MITLGIHLGHDATTSLIVDNKIVYNIAEERLNRIKHSAFLPTRSLDLLFKSTKINPSQIDYVAVSGLGKIDLIKELFQSKNLQTITPSSGILKTDNLRKVIRDAVGLIEIYNKQGLPTYQPRYPLKKSAKITQVDHHLSHISSAFFTSGFDKALVISSDGIGDLLSTTIFLGEGKKLTPLYQVGRNGSLGFFYSIVTEALGWEINEGEGKVMGLAPYGDTKRTKGVLDFIRPKYKDGKLIAPYNFGFASHYQSGGNLHFHYTQSEKVKKLIEKYGRENIAAEAQRVLEEEMLNLVLPWIKKTGVKRLAAAGGVFLNVKMNQRIWESGLLEDFYILPDSGDGGLALGASLYTNSLFDKKFKNNRSTHSYWGTEYKDKQIEDILKNRKIKYKKILSKKTLTKTTAKLLAEGNIIGWFQGKMESGPRALGNRSILMDPSKAENKDIINARVKYRESFRPFCPSMTPEAAKKYLVNPSPYPNFMIVSFDIKKEYQNEIPAVVHVDGTARPQVVTKQMNPLYFDLLNEFGKMTKVPVLLNTSFNIKGEPVVCTPSDAIKCFFDTGLDYLILGNFLLTKE